MRPTGTPVQHPDTQRKRRLATALAAALLAALLPVAPATATHGQLGARDIRDACPEGRTPDSPFTDIREEGSGQNDAIDCIYWYGITSGKTPTRYAPQESVTRGQMATFVQSVLEATVDYEQPTNVRDAFPDDDDSVHHGNINRLAAQGIVDGFNDRHYHPDTCSRAEASRHNAFHDLDRDGDRDPACHVVYRDQMASYFVRAIEFVTGDDIAATRDYFTDDDESVHESAINELAEIHVVVGKGGTEYDPRTPITREQMALFIARTLDYLAEQGLVVPPDEREQLPPSALILTPETDANVVDTSHTVVATVTDADRNQERGVTVTFEVYRDSDSNGNNHRVLTARDTTGDNRDDDGQTTSESAGQATFDYVGPPARADDTIVACVDTDNDGCASVDSQGRVVVDADDERNDQATKLWRQASVLTLHPQTDTNVVATTHTVTTTVTDDQGTRLGNALVRFEVYRDTDGDRRYNREQVAFDTTDDDRDDDGQAANEAPGEATFDYTGPTDPADDVIVACVVRSRDSGCGVATDPSVPPTQAEGTDQTDPTRGEDTTLNRTGQGGCDTSNDDTVDCADKHWIHAAAAGLRLQPKSDANPAGTEHTVTATVTDASGREQSGVPVTFEVYRDTAGDNQARYERVETGRDTTGDDTDDDNQPANESAGQATFDYTGPNSEADDLIVACVDRDNDGCATVNSQGQVARDPDDEFGDTATKNWEVLRSLVLTPQEDTNATGTTHTVVANVTYTDGRTFAGDTVFFEVYRDTDEDGSFDRVIAAQDQTGDGTDDDGQPASEGPGQATFDYVGPNSEAHDVIIACTEKQRARTEGQADPEGEFACPGVNEELIPMTQAEGSNQRDLDAGEDTTINRTGEGGCDRSNEDRTDCADKWWRHITSFTLTPQEDTNAVGSQHTVTATATGPDGPVQGVVVYFEVYRDTDDDGSDDYDYDRTETGQDTTDENGQATFTYTGPSGEAHDIIVACTDREPATSQGFPDEQGEQACPGVDERVVPLTTEEQTNQRDLDRGDDTRVIRTGEGGCDRTHQDTTDCADKWWRPASFFAASMTLIPDTDVNTTGEPHQVTATVRDASGEPVSGVTVYFDVFRDTDTDGKYRYVETLSDDTDEQGRASVTYTSNETGVDEIVACVDDTPDNKPARCAHLENGRVVNDTGENRNQVTSNHVHKEWTSP